MKKVLLIILGVVVGIIVILLIVAAFAKKEYTITRQITINKPRREVFDFVKYVKNQSYYNPWVMMDPNSRKEYKGTDGAVGFIATWDSENENVGQGEQEIVGLKEGQEVDLDLHFIRPFEGKADSQIATDSLAADQTKVTWSFHSSMPYPMNVMLVLADLEGALGNDLEKGLTTLKAELEK
jgi:hypothetical protein